MALLLSGLPAAVATHAGGLAMGNTAGLVASHAVFALGTDGSVVALNPVDGSVLATVARGALPGGGVAEGPAQDSLIVTAPGPDCPSLQTLALTSGRQRPRTLVADAELPALSPDGRSLAYVSLDDACQQDGIGFVSLDASGALEGRRRHFPSPSEPPALPITAVAVAPGGSAVAFAGGQVDTFLGAARPTTFSFNPSTARSLSDATALIDHEDPPILSPPGRAPPPPMWFSAPTYDADGTMILVQAERGISIYASNAMGMGVGYLIEGTGAVRSLALGPAGDLAMVGPTGSLSIVPGDEIPTNPFSVPSSPPAPVSLGGDFESVAWTPGPSALHPAPPPTLHQVSIPNVVGLSQAVAEQRLATLDLPDEANQLPNPAPAGTVVAQAPTAGTTMGCPCRMMLTVSRGP